MPLSPNTLLSAHATDAVQCVDALAPLAHWQAAAAEVLASQSAHVCHADLRGCATKAQVLAALAAQWALPAHFGHNWDALYDALTDAQWAGAQRPVLLLIDHVPNSAQFGAVERAQLLDCLRDAASDWAERGRWFRCFYRLD